MLGERCFARRCPVCGLRCAQASHITEASALQAALRASMEQCIDSPLVVLPHRTGESSDVSTTLARAGKKLTSNISVFINSCDPRRLRVISHISQGISHVYLRLLQCRRQLRFVGIQLSLHRVALCNCIVAFSPGDGQQVPGFRKQLQGATVGVRRFGVLSSRPTAT